MIAFLFTKIVSVEPIGNEWGVFGYSNRFEYAFSMWQKFGFRIMCHNLWVLWKYRNESFDLEEHDAI